MKRRDVMNTLTKRIAMLGVAGLMTAGAAAPSLAQTVIESPSYGTRTYHSYSVQQPMSGYAYSGRVAAPFAVQQPTECWTDEGYGRIASCDGGGGSQ
jgi:hypothetical protein